MSGDVGKVQGPSGAPDSLGKKDTSAADRERFQAVMREQVSTVGAIDPDEQKKRKRQEEIEEEAKTAVKAALENKTTTPTEPAPFLVTQSPAHIELLGMGGTKAGGASSSGPASGQADTLPSEELLQIPPSAVPHMAAPTSYPTPSPSAPSEAARPGFDQNADSSTTSQQGKEKGSSLKKTPAEAQAFAKYKEQKEKMAKEQEVTDAASLQEVSPPVQGVVPHAEEETPSSIQGTAGTTSAPGGTLSTSGKPPAVVQPLTTALPGGSSEPETPEVLHAQNAYAKLPPEAQELFNRMVGVMTVMQLSGIQETSFILNMPQFASSVFFGTRIIIQEFSTAPQMYNVQFNGSPQAVSLAQKHTAGLMAAFQANRYNFRIHRFETNYLEEREDKGDAQG